MGGGDKSNLGMLFVLFQLGGEKPSPFWCTSLSSQYTAKVKKCLILTLEWAELAANRSLLGCSGKARSVASIDFSLASCQSKVSSVLSK